MQIDLTGRVALVTGSTRGIGRAIAQALASAGADVAVSGRSAEQAAAVAGEIAAASGRSGRVAGFGADLSDAAQATALIGQVESSLGQVDILVNNAGLTRDNLLMRLKDEDWSAVIDANLRGAFV
jgi:3-oxoacyl-[acyl-carrier protein] reductase